MLTLLAVPLTFAAGAFAITAGLSANDITALARVGARPQALTVGLRVAGTLAALGVPPAENIALVSVSLRSGKSAADLLLLPADVESEVAQGLTPAAAAAGESRAAAHHRHGVAAPALAAAAGHRFGPHSRERLLVLRPHAGHLCPGRRGAAAVRVQGRVDGCRYVLRHGAWQSGQEPRRHRDGNDEVVRHELPLHRARARAWAAFPHGLREACERVPRSEGRL